MLDNKIVQTLKKSDISKDQEKVMARVKPLWKQADAEARQQTLDISGLKLSSIQRVYRTGSISIKIALSLGEAMNVDPRYLIGETDEMACYSDDIAIDMLREYGYTKEMRSLVQKKGWESRRKASQAEEAMREETLEEALEDTEELFGAADATEEALEPALVFAEEEEEEEEAPEAMLTYEECQLLLQALFLRAEYIPDSAKGLYAIKCLLLGL